MAVTDGAADQIGQRPIVGAAWLGAYGFRTSARSLASAGLEFDGFGLGGPGFRRRGVDGLRAIRPDAVAAWAALAHPAAGIATTEPNIGDG